MNEDELDRLQQQIDPLRAAKGIMNGIALGFVLWVLIFLVFLLACLVQ